MTLTVKNGKRIIARETVQNENDLAAAIEKCQGALYAACMRKMGLCIGEITARNGRNFTVTYSPACMVFKPATYNFIVTD